MNSPTNETFLFGTSCVPYALGTDWPQDQWDHDYETIKTLNFNTVRIFAAWERIEVSNGVYEFDKVDYAMELAKKHGLNIIIQFGGMFRTYCGNSIPEWWTESTCPDYQPYREKTNALMSTVVKRYCDHPNLLGWMIWNEPESDTCKCEHTINAYRLWLKDKYETIENLNKAWSTNKTFRYTSWDEVGFGSSKLAACEWLIFRQYRLANLLKSITQIVKDNDKHKHFTTSNIVNHFAALNGPYSAADFGVDLGDVAKSMDVMGFSFYHTEHSFDIEDHPAMRHAYKQSRYRSVSQAPNRYTYVLETGAGPNMRQLKETERTRLLWQMIGHNVKCILLWNYRSRISEGQVGLFHLVKWDGSVSRRAEAAADFAAILQQHASVFNHVFPKHQAAVLTPELNQIMMTQLCGPAHVPETYEGEHLSRFGAFKMLWDNKIGADCLTEHQYDDFGNYKLILLPMIEHMTKTLADMLEVFVKNGGTLIAESPFAFRDENGFLQYHAPGFGLDTVFGCWTNDRENKETAPEILYTDGTAETCLFWSEYTATTGKPEVLYANGNNAVISNRYGKGQAIIAGTEIFRQYMRSPQPAASNYFKKIISEVVEPDAICCGNVDNVEFLRLEGKPGIVYLIINHANEPRVFTASLRDGIQDWTNLLTGEDICPAQPIRLDTDQTLILIRKDS